MRRATASILSLLFLFGLFDAMVVPSAYAQNWLLAPAYGEVELVAGFPDDPYTVELTAGGSIDLSRIGYRGHVAEAPDFDLWYEPGTFPLTIRVETHGGDAVLLVNDPRGRWHYREGASGGDPELVFRRPAQGLYNIWVGTAHGGLTRARLVITEY